MANQQLTVPLIDYGDLKQRAEEFRRRFDNDEIVFPIESIVEFQLGLDIVPVPDLHKRVSTSGYLAQDRSEIMVDEYCLKHREGTYRYTLAHEVAHLELHGDLWQRLSFRDAIEWREVFTSALTDAEYGAIEWQANVFAGLVLVPEHHLRVVFDRHAASILELAKQYQGADQQTCFDVSFQVLSERMAEEFVVYPLTVGVRCDYDGLSDEFASQMFGPDHEIVARRRQQGRK